MQMPFTAPSTISVTFFTPLCSSVTVALYTTSCPIAGLDGDTSVETEGNVVSACVENITSTSFVDPSLPAQFVPGMHAEKL